MNKLINITALCKILNDNNLKIKKTHAHTIRYWEKNFRQIKPKIINNRRYYSKDDIELIKNIRYLLKIEKITILGAKNILNSKTKKLDYNNVDSLGYYSIKKKLLKIKTKKILNKIRNLKFVWFRKVIPIANSFIMQKNQQKVKKLKTN